MIKKIILIYSLFYGIAAITTGCSTTNHTDNSVVNNNTTVVAVAESNAPCFDVDAVIRQMGKRKIRSGVSSDAGVWVVCRIKISAENSKNQQQALALAEIRAKRTIGEWMNSSISKKSSLKREMKIEEDSVEASMVYSSLTKVKSEAFLRGITFHSFATDENGLNAYFYTTAKIADRSAELEAQLKAAPPGVVRAVGFGVIVDGKLAPAKRQATQAALRNAVEQVMGTTVIGQSQLMDNEKAKSKVISQTAGNIKEYRIVKEDKDGINYQIIINAKIDEQNLLDNYSAVVRSMGNPAFAIRCKDPDLKAAFSGFLADLGFKVVSNETDAEFIVDGDCKYLTVHHDYYGKGIQIDLNLRLIDKKSGQEFFNISNDPRFTTSFSGSTHQIRQSAAAKAFNKMRSDLHEKLNKVVMDWVLNGREVTVVFKNVADTSLDEVLSQAIADVPCAKFNTRSRKGDTLILHCSYVGPTADFEEFLRERMQKDLPPGTVLPKTNKIELNNLEFIF